MPKASAPFLVLWMMACVSKPPLPPQTPPLPDPVEQVDPFLGSGGFGFMLGSAFPGAAAPRGLIKVGPDTLGDYGTARFLHFSGYWYPDNVVQAFTHLHLHGTGASDYGVLGLMPLTRWTSDMTTPLSYQSPFDKATEHASPGFYDITLQNGPVRVELTASPHVAHHRYTFPTDPSTGYLILDLDKHLEGASITHAQLEAQPAQRLLTGQIHHVGGMSQGFGGYDVWFEMVVNLPWTSMMVWTAGAPPAPGLALNGTTGGAALTFDVSPHQPLEVLFAVSLTGAQGAHDNLVTEMPRGFDFDHTRQATRDEWAQRLNRAVVEGGTAAQRQAFYSGHYHADLMPTRVGDASNVYRAMDGTLVTASGYHYISDMSLWDTYRTLNPLLSVVAPEDSRDVAQSLLSMAQHGGFFPKWPLATGEAGTMLGSSAEVVVADAVLKNVPGVDAEIAYTFLRAAALDPVTPPAGRGGRNEAESYMQLGFVPLSADRSASLTVEYSQDDFALGNLAAALGHTLDAQVLLQRAHSWRALFDPNVGFLRGHNANGSVEAGAFDPTAFTPEFAEANAWQTLFGAPHDVEGLAALLGGRAAAVEKLTQFCQLGKEDFEANQGDPLALTLYMRPYLWPTNEPSLHVPYMFALLGRPDLTQRWVRWVEDTYFTTGPDGLPGNDDGGTLGAWLFFSRLGFYPLPGSDLYIVGAPTFTRATLQVAGGKFTVDAPKASAENIFVQSVTLNGEPLAVPQFHHAALRAGGTLHFDMGPTPSPWGVTP